MKRFTRVAAVVLVVPALLYPLLVVYVVALEPVALGHQGDLTAQEYRADRWSWPVKMVKETLSSVDFGRTLLGLMVVIVVLYLAVICLKAIAETLGSFRRKPEA